MLSNLSHALGHRPLTQLTYETLEVLEKFLKSTHLAFLFKKLFCEKTSLAYDLLSYKSLCLQNVFNTVFILYGLALTLLLCNSLDAL